MLTGTRAALEPLFAAGVNMLIFRILLILSALAIVLAGGLYLFTRNTRYLFFAWQVVRFVVFALLIFILLYLLERYVLVGMRILF